MALTRRKILKEALNLGVGTDTIPNDSGGTLTGTKINLSTLSDQGTALTAAAFALSAGFGSTASLALTSGSTDTRGQIAITCGGSNIAVNPTVTLTFVDGLWSAAPFGVISEGGTTKTNDVVQYPQGLPFRLSTTASTMVLTFTGTPISGEVYTVWWLLVK